MSLPAVIATTGHTEEEKAFIIEASRHQPIFMSANMSLGINLLAELSQAATELLQDAFDIEIVESHHNKKADAPSGTALLLADAIKSKLRGTCSYMYDRTKKKSPREKAEIGIHSVRGGAIFGEHEVIFAGQGEVIRLSHSALSRSVFAEGALAAALFMLGKPAGFYNMKNLIKSIT
jgi:4-hydroxy-tetrahydrodipicolinate reductase